MRVPISNGRRYEEVEDHRCALEMVMRDMYLRVYIRYGFRCRSELISRLGMKVWLDYIMNGFWLLAGIEASAVACGIYCRRKYIDNIVFNGKLLSLMQMCISASIRVLSGYFLLRGNLTMCVST